MACAMSWLGRPKSKLPISTLEVFSTTYVNLAAPVGAASASSCLFRAWRTGARLSKAAFAILCAFSATTFARPASSSFATCSNAGRSFPCSSQPGTKGMASARRSPSCLVLSAHRSCSRCSGPIVAPAKSCSDTFPSLSTSRKSNSSCTSASVHSPRSELLFWVVRYSFSSFTSIAFDPSESILLKTACSSAPFHAMSSHLITTAFGFLVRTSSSKACWMRLAVPCLLSPFGRPISSHTPAAAPASALSRESTGLESELCSPPLCMSRSGTVVGGEDLEA
mmetsp:Transcript_43742/g.103351  ORF Transcript_43742/g.103351 Transcript_43742/m.103351 type:complete len:280 (+) Transcript_43742:1928-2767(+)